MNKFFSNIKTLKYQLFNYSVIQLFALGLFAPACSNFLDIMPDNVLQYEDLFVSRKRALNMLAACYIGSPYDNRSHQPITLGDEWAMVNDSRTDVMGTSIMRGNQSATNTLMSLWTGHNTQLNLWDVIRDCNLLIQFVELVPDMTYEEKIEWKAQGKFMKAYYMFRMMEQYGPVLIPTTFDPGELNNSDLFQYRSKMEDCFDYVLNEIDEAIPFLKGKSSVDDLGMMDQTAAKALKARILLYRASPFYNGNSEYFDNFRDHNDEHFFVQAEDRNKWKLAAEAAQDALDACEQYGFRLYHFTGRPFEYDMDDFKLNTERMQTIYDLRGRITERWNEEIIWGPTFAATANMMRTACIKKPKSYGGPANANYGDGWAGASYQAMERYYTEHGLPISEDRTVNPNSLHQVVITPDENSPEYVSLRGVMQPAVPTVNMYLHREPRFYADLGITGGYYRSHRVRINTMMFQNSDGGYNPSVDTKMNPTGIAVQKHIHPDSYFESFSNWSLLPYPVIRVADLYLMKAEALNEYYGPTQEVYDAINEVRRRAGIPDVEESYSNPEWVTDAALDKHLSKEGMREIIINERTIEFAFETAHHFFHMQRLKRAVSMYSRPITGWSYQGEIAESFFNHKVVQARKWSITDCLWPIDNREMEKNAKLIQNPGW